jgi:Bacterial SH3 domain
LRKRISVLSFGVGLIGSALFGTGSALATEFCDIKQTAHGFVALRERPDAKGKLVARMKAGDEVMINNIVAEKNGWTRVYWWKGGRFQGRTVRGIEGADGQGWANSRLLGDECG